MTSEIITSKIIPQDVSVSHNAVRLIQDHTKTRSHGERNMRFMLLMIPGGYEQAAPGTMPPVEAVEEVEVE